MEYEPSWHRAVVQFAVAEALVATAQEARFEQWIMGEATDATAHYPPFLVTLPLSYGGYAEPPLSVLSRSVLTREVCEYAEKFFRKHENALHDIIDRSCTIHLDCDGWLGANGSHKRQWHSVTSAQYTSWPKADNMNSDIVRLRCL